MSKGKPPQAAQETLEARLRETTGLLEVARVVSSATDLAEALRLICHELARLTGAETASAHLLDARACPRQAPRPHASGRRGRRWDEACGRGACRGHARARRPLWARGGVRQKASCLER